MMKISSLYKNKKIYRILLLGGEPLLHPDILDFIRVTAKYFPTTERQLVTNGILLLKQSDIFWKTCNQTNTIVYITNYPIKINHEAIKNKSIEYNVKIEIEPEIKKFKKYSFDLSGDQNAFWNYLFCGDTMRCAQLCDGKLYACHQVAYIHHLNKYFNYKMQEEKLDYIDIYKVNSAKEISNYLTKVLPFCRYCNLKKRNFNCEWGLSHKEAEEWL